jgi:hypothetical protein
MIFYHLCDKLGMVVFQDMINNSDYSFLRDTVLPTVGFKRLCDKGLHRDKKTRVIFIENMYETLDLLHNTPSVLYYTVFNEGWGQFCADEVFSLAKEREGERIIDATSGWFIQKKSDVDSHHVYFKKIRLKTPAARPIVISEFGGYSHRVEGHLFGAANYGYRSFVKREEFEDALVALYENEIMPYVSKGLCAAVLTELSDIEDETNGIVTYDRRFVKLNPERIRSLMERIKAETEK